MSIINKPPAYSSMSSDQLQFILKKQTDLQKSLSVKLPDKGKKLEKSIALIQSLILSDVNRNPLPPQANSICYSAHKRLENFLNPSVDTVLNNEKDVGSDDLEKLTDNFDSLHLDSLKDKNNEEVESEDLSKLPDVNLTHDDVCHLRQLCGLPRVNSEDISCHCFVFRLNKFDSDLVRLTLIDCRKLERIFLRYGSSSTWQIDEDRKPHRTSKRPDVTTSGAGIAIAEMWHFIQLEEGDCPVLVADCVKSLIRLRWLFCSSGVRHHPGARNRLPRDIRFVVDSRANRARKLSNSEGHQESQSLNASEVDDEDYDKEISSSLMTCAALYSTFNAVDLAEMRPKTVEWIEAPLNLHALRVIAHTQCDSEIPYLPYTAPTDPNLCDIGDRQHSSESYSMLSSVDKSVLTRLAVAGFSPSSLTRLAGQARWRGFAGLLSTLGVARCPEVLSNLYCHFRRVHCSLKFITDLYREDSSKSTGGPLWSSSPLQLKALSMEESLKMMTRVRNEFSQKDIMTKTSPSFPPASASLLDYREQQAEDSDETILGEDSDD